MPIVQYPAFDNYSEFKGLFVGGCVERGDGSSFRAYAHAHTEDPMKGWICVRSARRVGDTTKPNMLMLHELAHLLSGCGHTDKWRQAVRQVGGKVDYWYSKEYNKCRRKGYRPRSLRSAKAYVKNHNL